MADILQLLLQLEANSLYIVKIIGRWLTQSMLNAGTCHSDRLMAYLTKLFALLMDHFVTNIPSIQLLFCFLQGIL